MKFMCTYRVGFPCLESLFLVCSNLNGNVNWVSLGPHNVLLASSYLK